MSTLPYFDSPSIINSTKTMYAWLIYPSFDMKTSKTDETILSIECASFVPKTTKMMMWYANSAGAVMSFTPNVLENCFKRNKLRVHIAGLPCSVAFRIIWRVRVVEGVLIKRPITNYPSISLNVRLVFVRVLISSTYIYGSWLITPLDGVIFDLEC